MGQIEMAQAEILAVAKTLHDKQGTEGSFMYTVVNHNSENPISVNDMANAILSLIVPEPHTNGIYGSFFAAEVAGDRRRKSNIYSVLDNRAVIQFFLNEIPYNAVSVQMPESQPNAALQLLTLQSSVTATHQVRIAIPFITLHPESPEEVEYDGVTRLFKIPEIISGYNNSFHSQASSDEEMTRAVVDLTLLYMETVAPISLDTYPENKEISIQQHETIFGSNVKIDKVCAVGWIVFEVPDYVWKNTPAPIVRLDLVSLKPHFKRVEVELVRPKLIPDYSWYVYDSRYPPNPNCVVERKYLDIANTYVWRYEKPKTLPEDM